MEAKLSAKTAAHHDEIVEEEDFSLVCRLFLGLVDVRHLEEPTAAHQPPVGDGEDLRTQAGRECRSLRGGTENRIKEIK